MRIECNNREYGARYSYERFILSQPHVKCEGLYRDSNGWYYIYCPDASDNTVALDGSSISRWLQQNGAVASPIQLTYSIPENVCRVATRTIEEMVHQTGSPVSSLVAYELLKKYLPRDFPVSGLEGVNKERNYITVILLREINTTEEAKLDDAVRKLGLPVDIETRVDSGEPLQKRKLPSSGYSDRRLLPIFYAPSQTPALIKEVYEEDEDFWVSSETELFQNIAPEYKRIRLSKPAKNACIVNGSVFPSINFRILYTMYDHVYLAMPIENKQESFLKSVQLTREDLILLAQSDRLTPLLPQSFHRYRSKDLEPILEASTQRVLGPRRLSALSMTASKRRLPLLYTSLNAEERALILQVLLSAAENAHIPESTIIQQLVASLSRIWQSTEELIQHRGTLGTRATGFGAFFADLVKSGSGTDAWLEISVAAQTLEWGIGLNADMIPVQTEGYDEYPKAEHLAALYSGFSKHPYVTAATSSGTIVEGILAINNDMPIQDLIDSISSVDRQRLKQFIHPAASGKIPADELADAILRFNEQVRIMEKRSDKLSKLNLGGLVEKLSGPAGVIAGVTTSSLGVGVGIASVGLLGWILGRLANLRSTNQTIGTVYDALYGGITKTSTEAAFVARIKGNI